MTPTEASQVNAVKRVLLTHLIQGEAPYCVRGRWVDGTALADTVARECVRATQEATR